jgi:RNA polymerase sigma-70 factor (ECF subfamily)
MTRNVLPFRRVEQRGLSDEALVRACADGDSLALEELFCRHGAQVHRVLARLRYLEGSDLDDIVQSTFLEVFRSAGRFRQRSAVSTWILGIAVNLVRHHVRHEVRRSAAMSTVARETPPVDERRPDDWASQRQFLGRLQDAFDGLPRDLRVVFALCDLEGLKGVDVAQALGVPEGTVWRRLHDARLRLRAHIEQARRP